MGRKSPYGLYDEALATFGEDDVYKQFDAEGFIRLFGLGTKVAARRQEQLPGGGEAGANTTLRAGTDAKALAAADDAGS